MAVLATRMVAWHHVLLTLLLRSVRLKRIHGNVCAIEGAAIANIDNPNWILDLRVSSCGFCCHLTGEDAAEIPQTFDCAAAELNALMMPGYHPGDDRGDCLCCRRQAQGWASPGQIDARI